MGGTRRPKQNGVGTIAFWVLFMQVLLVQLLVLASSLPKLQGKSRYHQSLHC